MVLPQVTESSELGALGVRLVEAIVFDDLGFLFRAKDRFDLGIDGEIEIVEKDGVGKRVGTGRLLAAQIKCGESFFAEEESDCYVYRGAAKHLEYWLNSATPVIIIICHPSARVAYWGEVTPGAIIPSKKGWKIKIPKSNVLSHSKDAIDRISRKNNVKKLIDVCVQVWTHARYLDRVEFCGIYELPRDYHWYDHLVQIGSDQVMLHTLYARYGRFELAELADVVHYYPDNKSFGDKLILCLVAESADAFKYTEEWKELLGKIDGVEVVRLIFDRDDLQVLEIDGQNLLIAERYRGQVVHRETIDRAWVG